MTGYVLIAPDPALDAEIAALPSATWRESPSPGWEVSVQDHQALGRAHPEWGWETQRRDRKVLGA